MQSCKLHLLPIGAGARSRRAPLTLPAAAFCLQVTDAAGQGAVLGWLDNADISEPKATAKILKDLYDMELAEEEVILAWAKVSACSRNPYG